MRRLSASDAMLLYNDSVLGEDQASTRVSIMDVSKFAAEEAVERVREGLLSTLNALPPFYWKQVPTPFGLHHPLWVIDPDFDPDDHIYRIGCPTPGTERELAEVVGMIASRPLDMKRPLWENWIVDGLADGHIAVVSKVHHALADGVGTVQMFDEVCTTEPVPHRDLSMTSPFGREPVPSKSALLRLAADDVVNVLGTVPSVIKRSLAVRRASRSRAPGLQPAQGHKAPPCLLNRRSGGRRRRFAMLTLPVADLRTVKNAFDVSLNDVYLAACAGAIQQFLLKSGELPDAPLVAVIGASIRTPDEANTYGNRVRAMMVRLSTTVEDPVERLAATRAETDIAKSDFALTDGARSEDIMAIFPPALQKALLRGSQRVMNRGRPMLGNVMLSNVPGPRNPLYIGEIGIDSLFGTGQIMPGIALNITAWSYVDQFNVSVLTDALTIPDPWLLADLLRDAFGELLQEAALHQAGG